GKSRNGVGRSVFRLETIDELPGFLIRMVPFHWSNVLDVKSLLEVGKVRESRTLRRPTHLFRNHTHGISDRILGLHLNRIGDGGDTEYADGAVEILGLTDGRRIIIGAARGTQRQQDERCEQRSQNARTEPNLQHHYPPFPRSQALLGNAGREALLPKTD